MIPNPYARALRLAVLEADAQALLQQSYGERRVIECIENPLPADARVFAITPHPRHWWTVLLLIHSDTFEWIEPGALLPELPLPVYRDVEAWERWHGPREKASS